MNEQDKRIMELELQLKIEQEKRRTAEAQIQYSRTNAVSNKYVQPAQQKDDNDWVAPALIGGAIGLGLGFLED